MKPLLLLIDFQQDYLRSPSLQPHADALCYAAQELLTQFRTRALPVLHLWTTVRSLQEMMPHWQQASVQRCISGTVGHQPPFGLSPLATELVLHKQFFSGFSCPELLPKLRSLGVDTLVLAGVHLRACVRTTAIDAYQHGLKVVIAEDAVGDDDPLHAALTRQYLEQRSIRFLPGQHILQALDEKQSASNCGFANHKLEPSLRIPAAVIAGQCPNFSCEGSQEFLAPGDGKQIAFWVDGICGSQVVAAAVNSCRVCQSDWERVPIDDRRKLITRLSHHLGCHAASLAAQITRDVGKPINDAKGEVQFAIELVTSAVRASATCQTSLQGQDWIARRRPQGVVAAITPWNNPLAIALGKLAPALIYGNAVVWKPAPAGGAIAHTILELIHASEIPVGVVNLLQGGRDVVGHLLSHTGVDAATFTGSTEAGIACQVLTSSRKLPFQAEMGGNNAAIIWSDTDLQLAARQVLLGGLGAAGQRCTATRRLIVDSRCREEFVAALHQVARTLIWGDPRQDSTHIGPVISAVAQQRLTDLLHRSAAHGVELQPLRCQPGRSAENAEGYFFEPTLAIVHEMGAELWQCESFGPIVVLHQAEDWEQAIELCNGVSQGLVACLFSESRQRQADFLNRAQAGMLRINVATAGANPAAPFSAWKASALGPVEHSVGDVEFYTRWQTVYGMLEVDSSPSRATPTANYSRTSS